MWFAVFGAPFAWLAQFSLMYWLTDARCRGTNYLNGQVSADRGFGIDLDVWVVVISIVALAVATAAGATAFWLFRETGDADKDDAPPPGRIHFLAIVGMAITPLFLAIIALNLAGVLDHGCTQS
jgi:hypothetical protein